MNHAFGLRSMVNQNRVAGDADNSALQPRRAGAFAAPAFAFSATLTRILARWFGAAFKFIEDVGERSVSCFPYAWSHFIFENDSEVIVSEIVRKQTFERFDISFILLWLRRRRVPRNYPQLNFGKFQIAVSSTINRLNSLREHSPSHDQVFLHMPKKHFSRTRWRVQNDVSMGTRRVS